MHVHIVYVHCMYVDVVTILENSKMVNVGILGITLKRNKSVDKNALVCSLFRTIELKKPL